MSSMEIILLCQGGKLVGSRLVAFQCGSSMRKKRTVHQEHTQFPFEKSSHEVLFLQLDLIG